MSSSPQWRTMAKAAADDHADQGYSFIVVGGEVGPGQVAIDTSSFRDDWLAVRGQVIFPRRLRQFWWERRHSRAFQRLPLVLWTSYDEEDDTSYAGVGAIVDGPTADRLGDRARILMEQL